MRTDESKAIVEPAVASERAAEEAEILHASLKAGTIAQIVVAAIAVIGLIYLLKLVLVTILVSILLAYVLEPTVNWLSRLRIPRWLGAFLAVLATVVMIAGLSYFSYNRAIEFADQLPNYSLKLRDTLGRIRHSADQVEDRTRSTLELARNGRSPAPIKVEESQRIFGLISKRGGTILDVSLAIGFVPFLTYFMLTLKDHSHVATVRLFPKEHRILAHRAVGTISSMIRSYIIANFLTGVLNSAICTLIFGLVGIKYFYFIGTISGFVSLIPYLGIFLAPLVPVAGGIDTLNRNEIMVVVVAVVTLHVATMNFVYPKFIGERLKLNPLAVSLSLLFWAWIWGAPGLILAIPLLGAARIVCDHVEPLRALGSWLGQSLKPS